MEEIRPGRLGRKKSNEGGGTSMTSETSTKNWPWIVAVIGAALLALALFIENGEMEGAVAQVTNERLMNTYKEPENWITHHGNYEAHRFSRLDAINRKNVKELQVTGTIALGGIQAGGIWPFAGYEATPIVEDGYLYIPDGWGTVYKFDVRDGIPRLVWEYDPEIDRDWAGNVTCCGVNNRGIALWNNKVVSHVLDGRLLVLDKKTGELIWERKVADPDKSETITAAPLIVKNLAITGIAGGEYGIRGWLAATDLLTGEEVWRTYTIPAPRRAGSRDLEGRPRGLEDGRRIDLGHRHVRCGSRPHLLGDRQSGPGLGQRLPPRRQPLLGQRARTGRYDRRDQVALSVHAERSLRLRRDLRTHPRRY